MHRPSALQIDNAWKEEIRMADQYQISNSGAQTVKAIKPQNIKKGKSTVKTGKDLRAGK